MEIELKMILKEVELLMEMKLLEKKLSYYR